MTSKTEADPYSVLGVARTASDSEIRAAYHALVAKYHPDRYQGNPLEDLANEKLVAINRAYEILSDPARRAAHDSGQGFAGNAGQPYATGPGSLTRKQIRWLQIVAMLLMVPLAIWVYTLVAVLSSLWFAHYCLQALQALRLERSVDRRAMPASIPALNPTPLNLEHDRP